MIPCGVHCHSVGDPENHIFSSAVEDFFISVEYAGDVA